MLIGRLVRNIFEKLKFCQANRIVLENDTDINTIKKEDIIKVLEQEKNNNLEKQRRIGF